MSNNKSRLITTVFAIIFMIAIPVSAFAELETTTTKNNTIIANFVPTGTMEIAPESAGDAAGKVFVEYKLVADTNDISLAFDNAEYIKYSINEREWHNIAPDDDATLWLDVEFENCVIHYKAKTIDGNIYTTTIDWNKELKQATWSATGEKMDLKGLIFVEHILLYGEEKIPLKKDDVKLVAVKKEGKWVNLILDNYENLWFNEAKNTGDYEYIVITNDNLIYKATLNWNKSLVSGLKVVYAKNDKDHAKSLKNSAIQCTEDLKIKSSTILVGGPLTNALTKEYMNQFPVSITNSNPGKNKGTIQMTNIKSAKNDLVAEYNIVLLAGSDRYGTQAAVEYFKTLEEVPEEPITVLYTSDGPLLDE
ncbi:FlaG/FlaF family flagellin (archaellin) [Methanococcus voltae]|uniref:S-layer protein n=1 Tax=Methanococcus voltae TaxID=2188 RepID=UPI001AE9ABD6|nr:S-layer protein [Methanococcus voltae]MBP2143849.1 FlaG/FlaF family flagellin (archaellin) [Methanococcus voltae]